MPINKSKEIDLANLINEINSKYGTPFYIFEEQRFINNLENFKSALNTYYDRVIIGYSFKTNYTPAICQVAKENGCFAEVVSRMELELADKLNFNEGHIIFNGPYKTKEDIEYALKLGAIINIDHIEQIDLLGEIPSDRLKNIKAGLRVNIDLNEKLLAKKIAKGGIIPRFGMDRIELRKAKDMLNKFNIEVVSLHGHCSSSDRAPENYSAIAEELLRVRSEFQFNKISYFDIGGGFSGRIPRIWNQINSPSFKDYAKAIFNVLLKDSWFTKYKPNLVIEPGMSVVADVISLVTSIVSKKKISNNLILGADASFYNVRPTFHHKPLTYNHIKQSHHPDSTESIKIKALAGSTCMERDILLQDIVLASPSIGDLISIEDVGAYCSVLTPNFINYQPAVYSVLPDFTYKLIKKEQVFDEFYSGYIF